MRHRGAGLLVMAARAVLGAAVAARASAGPRRPP